MSRGEGGGGHSSSHSHSSHSSSSSHRSSSHRSPNTSSSRGYSNNTSLGGMLNNINNITRTVSNVTHTVSNVQRTVNNVQRMTGQGNPHRRPMNPSLRPMSPPPPPPRPVTSTPYMAPPPPPSIRPPQNTGGYQHPQRNSNKFGLGCLIVFLIVCFVILGITIFSLHKTPASTVNREKIEGSNWNNSCVYNNSSKLEIDESAVSKGIRKFYDETGVQPWFYAASTEEFGETEEKREDFAEKYYQATVKNEDALLWVYWDDPDSDETYSTLIIGNNTATVIDAEAEDVFWSFYDYYYNSDNNDTEFVINVFNSTAKRIMTKSTTGMDVLKYIVIGIIIIAIITGIIVFLVLRRKHEAERAAEIERILNASMDDLADDI